MPVASRKVRRLVFIESLNEKWQQKIQLVDCEAILNPVRDTSVELRL